MQKSNHDAIRVVHVTGEKFALFAYNHDDERDCVFIHYVYGFENAVRTANGIAHDQYEWVTHPGFDPNELD